MTSLRHIFRSLDGRGKEKKINQKQRRHPGIEKLG